MNLLQAPRLQDVRISDGFLAHYYSMIPEKTILYQWEIFNNRVALADKSYCVRNFKIAAGLERGEYKGTIYQDSDLYKWLECVGYALQTKWDDRLEGYADEVIALIEKAQCPDGYVNTYYTLACPDKRWTNLQEGHELYCAGHLFEAAVAYYQGTGKDRLLGVACRFADYIDRVFGRADGQIRGYPGHQEIELALVKLYRVTGQTQYLHLAKYFIDERGNIPNYFDKEMESPAFTQNFAQLQLKDRTYAQSHIPPVRQQDAVGHSVRAVYMYSAMADLAAELDDETLLIACRRLFDSIANRRMYITGGIGSAENGERFTADYDLPGDYGYMETCASIGLMMFAARMMCIERDARYIDVLERAFYNTALAGISLNGAHFFYVNPLSVTPAFVENNANLAHVKPERQQWFETACCPTNIARTLTSLGQYIYAYDADTVYVNLYIDNEARFPLDTGDARVRVQTAYPFRETVSLILTGRFTAALRIPFGCRLARVTENGAALPMETYDCRKGYLYLSGDWAQTNIELTFDMPARRMRSHPRVSANAGCVALMKGPIVYCMEEIDNGGNLSALSLGADEPLAVEAAPQGLPSQADSLVFCGFRDSETGQENTLYTPKEPQAQHVRLRAVPYCLWANRGKGEMRVFIREATQKG